MPVSAAITAAGAAIGSASHIESAWSKLKGPCWMLLPKSAAYPRTTSGDLRHGSEMSRWMMLYKRGMHDSKPTPLWKREARWLRPRKQNCLQQWQVHDKTCCMTGKVWRGERGIRYSISKCPWCFPHCQRNGLLRHRALLLRIVYRLMLILSSTLKTRWRHRLSTMLC